MNSAAGCKKPLHWRYGCLQCILPGRFRKLHDLWRSSSTSALQRESQLVVTTPGGPLMSPQNTRILKGAVLIAAFLLLVPQALAGEHVRAGKPPVIRSRPAFTAVAHAGPQPEIVSVIVTTPVQPTAAPVYVDIRGPDGQVRRFPVEGGRAAIQYRQVILHAGEMLTLHWTAPK
jgi:hypothetical protein